MPARKAPQSDGSETPAQPGPSKPRRTRRPVSGAEITPPALGEVVEAPAIDEDGSWVEADAVEVRQGAVGRVDATQVDVTQGAIGAARADRISVQMGGIGAAMAGEIDIAQGGAGSVLAQRVRIDQAFVRTLVAQQVEIHRPSAVLVLIAQRVSGDIRPLLDWRGALALGAAFGILAGLFGRVRGRG
jgi:hypothetical protein